MMKRVSDCELAEMNFADRFEVVSQSWRDITLEDVVAGMPELTTVKAYGGTPVKVALLKPNHVDIDDTRTIVRFSEFLNGYNPVQWIGAEVTRQLVTPNSRMIMMPNNSFGQANHIVPNKPDAIELFNRDALNTLARNKSTALDHIDRNKYRLGKIGLTGWSFGANMALAVASLKDRQLEVVAVNADEPVSKIGRTAKELSKDFMKSGGFGEQRQAGKDSGIPAINQAFNALRLIPDYMKFGIASQGKEAKQLLESMTGDVNELVKSALSNNPDIQIKLGQMVGSLIFEPSSVQPQNGVEVVAYDGPTNRRHATVNNPLVQGYMAHQGLTI